MTWTLLFGLLFIFVLTAFYLKWKKPAAHNDSFPYIKLGVLFSAAERSFLGVLQQAVGAEYAVFGKVRIADVVNVKPSLNRSVWRKAFNRINAKHFDYVICSITDYSVVAVVELDDKSHNQRERKERDKFIVELCRVVSLPFLQVPAQRAYSINAVKEEFLCAIGRGLQDSQVKYNGTTGPIGSNINAPITVGQVTDQASTINVSQTSKIEPQRFCPKCSALMVSREVKTGSKAGKKFWGCSTFPKCRAVTLSD